MGLAASAALLGAGCAVLTLPGRRPPRAARAQPATARSSAVRDYVGALHIHTQYSDGAGTYEEIAQVANAQRLDFLLVTDHNTLRPLRERKEGWYGMTLVLVGTELSTRGGHYLALNVQQEIDRHALTTQEIIDEVNRQGGLGFIAHPYFKKRRWADWTVSGFTGIEAYNVAHDTLDENRLRLVMWTLTVPAEPFYFSILDRPYDPLRTWDELIARHGRVVGIGATDAHEVRLFGLKFAPYEVMFRLIRTHVLIPSDTLTAQGIYDALRQGHAYLSIELAAEARGFTFAIAGDDGRRGIMGDEVTFEPGLRLEISTPATAQLMLWKDGRLVAETIGGAWEIPVEEPGVYRIEAFRHGKPWIFSNPIYVRPAAAAASSTQHTEWPSGKVAK